MLTLVKRDGAIKAQEVEPLGIAESVSYEKVN